MNTDNANKYLDAMQISDRSVWDKKDIEHPLDCLLEDYHQEQLKLLGVSNIAGKSEQLAVYKYPPDVACSVTPQIKSWLEADDSGRKWKQGDNPNCFTNNRLEALYVYDDKIKYWEDIRAKSAVVEHRIPKSKSELYLII